MEYSVFIIVILLLFWTMPLWDIVRDSCLLVISTSTDKIAQITLGVVCEVHGKFVFLQYGLATYKNKICVVININSDSFSLTLWLF